MACEGCQERREAIRRLAAQLGGVIVFGGKKRVLVAPEKVLESKQKQVENSAVEVSADGRPSD